MQYRLRNNHCKGWWQGVLFNDDGSEHSASREFTGPDGRRQAIEAVHFHHKHGKWPREVEEEPLELCPTCGQPMPED